MAQFVINQAIIVGNLDYIPPLTENLQIHGYQQHSDIFSQFKQYCPDSPDIGKPVSENPEFRFKLHPHNPYVAGEVVWAVLNEMARNIDYFLAQRTRLLFFGARAAVQIAEKTAHIMANEIGMDKHWIYDQVNKFNDKAKNYLTKVSNQVLKHQINSPESPFLKNVVIQS